MGDVSFQGGYLPADRRNVPCSIATSFAIRSLEELAPKLQPPLMHNGVLEADDSKGESVGKWKDVYISMDFNDFRYIVEFTGVFPVILLPPVFAKMCWEAVCFVSFRKGKLFILHYFSMRILG